MIDTQNRVVPQRARPEGHILVGGGLFLGVRCARYYLGHVGASGLGTRKFEGRSFDSGFR